jgi:hypothetical protein
MGAHSEPYMSVDLRRDALVARLTQSKQSVRRLIASAPPHRALMIECVRLVDDLDEVESLLDEPESHGETLAAVERLLALAERRLATLEPRTRD